MSGIDCSIVVRLGGSILRHSTNIQYVWLVVWEGFILYLDIFCHGSSLYQHKETIGKNLEFEKSSTFFILKVFYFLKHFSIIYVLLYITL